MSSFKPLKKGIKGAKKLTKKNLPKPVYKMTEGFFDFWLEIYSLVLKKKAPIKNLQKVDYHGTTLFVRPAYIFARKIENLLQIILGISIIISAVLATFIGLPKIADILATLIGSGWGRILLGFVGFSYFMIGFYKILHLTSE